MQIKIVAKMPATRFPKKDAHDVLMDTFEIDQLYDEGNQDEMNDDLEAWMYANLDANSSHDDGDFEAQTEDGTVVGRRTWNAKEAYESEKADAQW
jgi:hypothetical protein